MSSKIIYKTISVTGEDRKEFSALLSEYLKELGHSTLITVSNSDKNFDTADVDVVIYIPPASYTQELRTHIVESGLYPGVPYHYPDLIINLIETDSVEGTYVSTNNSYTRMRVPSTWKAPYTVTLGVEVVTPCENRWIYYGKVISEIVQRLPRKIMEFSEPVAVDEFRKSVTLPFSIANMWGATMEEAMLGLSRYMELSKFNISDSDPLVDYDVDNFHAVDDKLIAITFSYEKVIPDLTEMVVSFTSGSSNPDSTHIALSMDIEDD